MKTKGLVWLVQHKPAKTKLCNYFAQGYDLPGGESHIGKKENEIAITKFMYASLGMPTSLMVSRNSPNVMPVYDNEPRGIVSFQAIKPGFQSPSKVLIPQNTHTKSYTKPLEFNSNGNLAWINKDTDCERHNCLMRVCLNKPGDDTKTPGPGFIIDNNDTTCDNQWEKQQIGSWSHYIDNNDISTDLTWPMKWVSSTYGLKPNGVNQTCSKEYTSTDGWQKAPTGVNPFCFPWTGIGNTYNWNSNDVKHGVNGGYHEYVMPANSQFNADSFSFTPLSEINTQAKMNYWCPPKRDNTQTGRYGSSRY